MRAHNPYIHTHTKWERMVDTVVLRPARNARRLLERVKTQTVTLEELKPQMLAEDPLPAIDLTREQAEDLSQLAAHRTGSH